MSDLPPNRLPVLLRTLARLFALKHRSDIALAQYAVEHASEIRPVMMLEFDEDE
jgi:hypothetical protein